MNTVTSGSERYVSYSSVAIHSRGVTMFLFLKQDVSHQAFAGYARIEPGAPQQGKGDCSSRNRLAEHTGRRKEGGREEIYGPSYPRVHHCLLGTGSILIKSSFLGDRFPLYPAHLPHRHCEVPHISPRSLSPLRSSIQGKDKRGKNLQWLFEKKKEGPSNIKAITVRYCSMGPL